PNRTRYLSEIAENNRNYKKWAEKQSVIAQKLYALKKSVETINELDQENKETVISNLEQAYDKVALEFDPKNQKIIADWPSKKARYKEDLYKFKVRNKELAIKTNSESLSHSKVPKVTIPGYKGWGDILLWILRENVPGEFPYTAGIYPFKREGEDPTRMFAGEGSPERTNRRFHYVSLGMPAKRLSTAFDSVTLYGQDPDHRPDIYGKIGNAGVSICCLDD
ncbi:MAG: methylmalonyl-CoA mutase, partial [Deltaproteobacteria bacterium]|nr:methylmalonyl-CoA mutase [Deltaproteobacteria bacterium]